MSFRVLDKSFIPEVVHIHIMSLKGISTLLGKKYLTGLYTMLMENSSHKFEGYFINKKLVGVVISSSQPLTTLDIVSRSIQLRDYWTLLFQLFKKNVSWEEIIDKLRFERILKKILADIHVYIFFIGVLPSYQKMGIGTKLLSGICINNKTVIAVDTSSTNRKAQYFYNKLGFKKAFNSVLSVVYIKNQ